MDVCIFGASGTYGAYDLEKGGWANRLRIYLENNENRFDIGPRNRDCIYNVGISGDNTEKLLKRFSSELIARNSEVAIIAIGTNDSQYLLKEKRNRISIDTFKKNIEQLIAEAKEITKEIIFIGLSPVDESKTNPIPWDENKNKCYKNSFIKQYSDAIKEICKNKNIKFIELFDYLMKEDYKGMLYDGLHPDVRGHEWIFQKVIKELNL